MQVAGIVMWRALLGVLVFSTSAGAWLSEESLDHGKIITFPENSYLLSYEYIICMI